MPIHAMSLCAGEQQDMILIEIFSTVKCRSGYFSKSIQIRLRKKFLPVI